MSNTKNNAPMSLVEMRQLSDDEIINMYQKAQGHTRTADFKKVCNTDFSYSSLTCEMKNRNIPLRFTRNRKNGETTVCGNDSTLPRNVYMTKDGMTLTRHVISVDSETYRQWKTFIEKFTCPSVLTTAALRQFMEDFNAGKIRIEIPWD